MTKDYAAEDTKYIRKRMDEIAAENSMPPPPPTIPECVGCDTKREFGLKLCDDCPFHDNAG